MRSMAIQSKIKDNNKNLINTQILLIITVCDDSQNVLSMSSLRDFKIDFIDFFTDMTCT